VPFHLFQDAVFNGELPKTAAMFMEPGGFSV
jgi:hypothetical protein